MEKKARIRSRKDFVRISKKGVFYKTKVVIVQADSNLSERFRVGFTASRKVGNAVVRNRCKRRMRAAADEVVSKLGFGAKGIDYVFIARKSVFSAPWLLLIESFKSAVLHLNDRILKCKKML